MQTIRILACAAVHTGFLLAGAATADTLQLRSSAAVGDRYTMSLSTSSRTIATSPGKGTGTIREDRRFEYDAQVLVQGTTSEGRIVRERHDEVRLTAVLEDGSTARVSAPSRIDVVYQPDGDLEFISNGGSLERPLRKIVQRLLRARFERSALPDLLDPGRSVEIGEHWPLDGAGVRRALHARGFKALKMRGAATATLLAGPDGERVIRYEIPVSWTEPLRMPANARSGDSEALLAGRVRLPSRPGAGPARHLSTFAVEIHGAIVAAGSGRSRPWHFESRHQSDERVVPMPATRISGL